MTFRVLFCIFLLFFSGDILYGQPIIQITNDPLQGYMGKKVSVFQDSSNQLTISDLITNSAVFKRNDVLVPNFGISNFNNWIKFNIVNNTDENHLYLMISNATIDHATLYKVKGGKVDSLAINRDDPSSLRSFSHQFYTYDLLLNKGDSMTCYLKLVSTKQLLAPLSINNQRETVGRIMGFDLRSGIYIGIMLTMILYNLFLFFSARDRHYLVYVHYIFWVSIAQLAILGYFQRFSFGQNISDINLVTFAGAMSGIASVIFVKSFLNIKKYGPKLNNWLNVIIFGDLIAIVLLLLNRPIESYGMVNFVAGLGSIVVLIVGYVSYRKGNQSAMLFMIAWGIFLGSVIVYVLKDYGILTYNQFTAHAVQIGASLEALLLSFALGDKINTYRKEKEESQARELTISQENERLIREQNFVLEQKVNERTRELTESNESLQTTLTHLKETQSQLVEAEKMASLGQLTAGVAHEINNPINFVTSNVAPLKRDIKMVWETLDEVERIAFAEELSLDEKLAQIKAYKEDIDIDYLKTEVDFLLRGMHDGASRTAEIVKSLRIFSRVDEDTLKYADINEGLESTLVILGSIIKEGIEVDKLYGDIPQIECYAGKLNQVFLNILTNAIYAINKKYDRDTGGKLKIETGICDDDSFIYINIVDNGIGIPNDIREKIFEPFFTTKDVGEGTGLGMSIAYNTIAKHEGKIIVESEVGEGTLFKLIIPIKQDT
ncbi:His Kinase A (phospho-acceptor) domain-containing protein [Sphingobacterium nematocida]|uniref:histidine kinase n=1 Tax=Sphingobacterium nematocida TaxID=1513896 RepID=A0A1T5FRV6_9SPHI|nr:7TM diverse intracellular signaling domain-containing protein [Sphingobacterium nematocida]SKB98889.1 His Kinase A (phospho-acceptor) domain-containing protein [Sphingobacterium nematocida]